MKRLATIVQIAACLLFFVSATARAEDKKNDPNGTWTWTQQGRQGGQEREMTLKLKTEGDKLTGTLTMPGRNGSTDTKIDHGKVSGDSITGKVSTERNGETRDRDWTAKRKSDTKKDDSKKS